MSTIVFPIRVRRLTKNNREAVVVSLRECNGHRFFDLRVHASPAQGDIPTPKGVTFDLKRLPALREAVELAEAEARRLDPEGGR